MMFERTDSPATFVDLVDNIELVPLETGPDFVAGAEGLEIAGTDFLLIRLRQNPAILRFDATGRFLGRIGRYGRGPGEYQFIQNIQVQGNEVTVFTVSDDILTYNLQGESLREQKTEGAGMQQSWRVPEGILTYKGYGSATHARVVLYTPDGEQTFLETDAKVLNLSSNYNLFCQVGSNIYFSDTYNPTVYRYENGQVEPAITFDLGKVALPEKFYQFDDAFAASEYMLSAPDGFGLLTLFRRSEACQLAQVAVQKDMNADTYYGICKEDGAWRWFSLGKSGESPWAGALRTIKGKDLYFLLDAGLLSGPDHGMGGQLAALRDKISNPEVLEQVRADDNPVVAKVHLK